jgi:hypothetical protein
MTQMQTIRTLHGVETLILGKDQFKKTAEYWSDYVGSADLAAFEGDIEIGPGLGYVAFPRIRTKGSVVARSGTGVLLGEGIDAGGSIKVAWGLKTGAGIKARESIEVGWAIDCGESIVADGEIKVGTNLKADRAIKAGRNISAGAGIKAGWDVTAGGDIAAGEGIEAGLAIACGGRLRAKLRIFAGLCLWRLPSAEEKTITCSKLDGGEIAFGMLRENP